MSTGAMEIAVRDAVAADATCVADLSAQLGDVLRRAGNPVGASLTAEVIRRDGFGSSAGFSCVVAEASSDGIVGYALLHPAYDPDLGGRIFTLVDLYVRPDARRHGVGTLLMDAALERAAAAGARALSWWIREQNREGVAFYRALGAEGARGLLSMHLPVGRA